MSNITRELKASKPEKTQARAFIFSFGWCFRFCLSSMLLSYICSHWTYSWGWFTWFQIGNDSMAFICPDFTSPEESGTLGLTWNRLLYRHKVVVGAFNRSELMYRKRFNLISVLGCQYDHITVKVGKQVHWRHLFGTSCLFSRKRVGDYYDLRYQRHLASWT
jgi:hypothetical protein